MITYCSAAATIIKQLSHNINVLALYYAILCYIILTLCIILYLVIQSKSLFSKCGLPTCSVHKIHSGFSKIRVFLDNQVISTKTLFSASHRCKLYGSHCVTKTSNTSSDFYPNFLSACGFLVFRPSNNLGNAKIQYQLNQHSVAGSLLFHSFI